MSYITKSIEIILKLKATLWSDNILGKSLRGGSILATGSIIENFLRFARNVILARLLAPEAFGLMATVLAVVAVMEAFTEVGLRQSVIQHKHGSEDLFTNIVWWMSSCRGFVLYVIGFLAAPFICDFYQKPEMLLLIRVGFLSILFNGFISPKVHVLEKEMRFKGWVFLMQGSGIMGVIITMAIAFFFQNVWALVIGFTAESFLRSSLSFIFYPIKPSLKFDKLFFSDIFTFSKKMFGLPILMLLFVQTDIFVIGKVLSMAALGMYALAKSLAEIPNTFLSKALSPILLPTLAQIQDDKDKLKANILLLTKWTMAIGLPLISFFVFFANPILSVIYGPKYAAVAVPFALLSIYNLISICATFPMFVFIAIGQPDIQRSASFMRTALFLIIIYPAIYFGELIGAAAAVLFSMLTQLAVAIIYLKRLLHITNMEYFASWSVGIKPSLIVILPGILLNTLMQLNPLTTFILGIILCCISWIYAILKELMVKTNKTVSVSQQSK